MIDIEKRRMYARKWREKNREKARLASKRYREANKEKERQRQLNWRGADTYQDWRKEHNRLYRRNNPATFLLRACRTRARLKGWECNLQESDIVVPAVCPVLGIDLKFGVGSTSDSAPSVDRIDSSKGYTRDNIIVVSWRANRFKNNATPEELRKLADFYTRLETKSGPSISG